MILDIDELNHGRFFFATERDGGDPSAGTLAQVTASTGRKLQVCGAAAKESRSYLGLSLSKVATLDQVDCCTLTMPIELMDAMYTYA